MWDSISHLIYIAIFQEADIGIGPFTITSHRMEVIDFLQPVTYEKLTMLMRKPMAHQEDSGLTILKPFTSEVSETIALSPLLLG